MVLWSPHALAIIHLISVMRQQGASMKVSEGRDPAVGDVFSCKKGRQHPSEPSIGKKGKILSVKYYIINNNNNDR